MGVILFDEKQLTYRKPLGRPLRRREDNIKVDLKIGREGMASIQLASGGLLINP
jgi:hypothetical protein